MGAWGRVQQRQHSMGTATVLQQTSPHPGTVVVVVVAAAGVGVVCWGAWWVRCLEEAGGTASKVSFGCVRGGDCRGRATI